VTQESYLNIRNKDLNSTVTAEFDSHFESRKRKGKLEFSGAYFTFMFKVLRWSLFWMVIAHMIELMNPYLIRNMILWVSKDEFEWQEGFGYAAALGLITGFKIYFFRRGGFLIAENQVKSQAIVNHVIMSKVIRMSSSTLGIVEFGSITSLLSGDGMQLLVFNFFINTLIMVPIIIICITSILVYEFGYICFVTPIVFALLIWI